MTEKENNKPKNVYGSGELFEDSTCANFAQVADNGRGYRL